MYGGAGRVYPVDLGWTSDPFQSPLHLAYDARGGERATSELIGDALRMARDAGLLSQGGTTAENRPTSGVVATLVEPSRAVVRLNDGSLATVWQELTADEIPLERLLHRGMPVTGTLDIDTGRLNVTSMRTGRDAVDRYEAGDVVLARVSAVRPDVVHLALHPEVVVPVQRHQVSDDPAEVLTALFTVGETVVARIASRDGDRIALSLQDLDDDEPLAAPPVLAGGPPWLLPPERPVHLSETAHETPPTTVEIAPPLEPVPPAPAALPRGAVRNLSLTLEAAKAEIRRLEAELAAAHAALGPAEAERDQLNQLVAEQAAQLRALEDHTQRQRTQLRRYVTARKQQGGSAEPDGAPHGPLFADPEEQFRYEVYVEWATRITAGEKAERPLRDYVIGPEFLASVDKVEGVDRRKVVSVVVEVVTGLVEQLAGRDLHPLRTGPGGDDPPALRKDGAVCMRAALQRNTPSARQLHYWRMGDRIELSRVALHDDMRP